MSIDSIDVDLDCVWSLEEWLQSETAETVQRQLEERITKILFSHDPESRAFQIMAAQLAWIGSRPEDRPFLEKEILALNLFDDYSVETCGFFKEMRKTANSVANFVVEYKKEILIGIVVAATGVGIAIVTGYSLSVVAGGIVVAGASSVFQAEEKPNPHIPPVPLPDPKACSQSELALIQGGLPTTLPRVDLPSSAGELLVATNGVWFNNQFFPADGIRQQSLFAPSSQKNAPEGNLGLSMSSPVSDWRTFHNYLARQQDTNGEIPYQVLGESALALGNYNQAIHDFGKAIEIDPANPFSYLERGSAHFALGEYDRSLEDYQQFASQTKVENPLSVSEFCGGFAKGLPKGVYESGEGVLLFLADFVKHPVQTSKQMIDAITMLADLVRQDEWGAVAEALSPELHQLVTQWDSLPSDQRGELAGYAVGKHGTDILAPGALAKVASKSVKSAQELVAVCKNIQIVQETLILETAAGIGNSAKITEVIEVGRKTAFLADELGFTAREMGQLKQAGQLETSVASACEHLPPPMRESFEFFKKAQDFLEQYKGFMPESQARELIHQTGVRTFARPQGIPENFRVKISGKGAGMEYVHPTNTHIRVRIMPGKPHSPLPHQQKPYVVHTNGGQALDRFGNKVEVHSPEAHIPYEEFVYRG